MPSTANPPLPHASPGPTSRIFFSQRLRLHYVDWGNGKAKPLVLVHGGRDHCRNWDWVAQELRGDWHIIAPDLRGHGDSQWCQDGTYMMAGYVYDLAQLIHQLKLAPVTIIAHSLGGNIALRYAGLYPENVARLVAIEGMGRSPRRAATPFAERMRCWIEEQRSLSGRMPRRYATIEDAFRRMQEENRHLTPEQARHLTQHGVNQNEDGTYSWKFAVLAALRHDDRRDRGAMGAHFLPDPAGVREREPRLQSADGRPRQALSPCRRRHRRGRRPLGASRPSRRVHKPRARVSRALIGASGVRLRARAGQASRRPLQGMAARAAAASVTRRSDR